MDARIARLREEERPLRRLWAWLRGVVDPPKRGDPRYGIPGADPNWRAHFFGGLYDELEHKGIHSERSRAFLGKQIAERESTRGNR